MSALLGGSAWLATGCGGDDDNGNGTTTTGGTGGMAGSSTANGGDGPSEGGEGGMPNSEGGMGGSSDGGMGGAAAGAGGAAAGAGGTPATDPCDDQTTYDLPSEVGSGFIHLDTIGPSEWEVVTDVDCDAVIDLDAGVSDAGAADSGSPPVDTDASVTMPDGGVMGDAGSGDGGVVVPECWIFDYPAADWGGVIFQSNALIGAANTGDGICIEEGATRITFMARSDRDGARIKFGSIREGLTTTEHWINITTEWAEYEAAIPVGDQYNLTANSGGVWNGFSAVAEAGDHPGGSRIWIKDMTWRAPE
jgi:hypothetical protein